MKNLLLTLGLIFYFLYSDAQNIGIGTNTPHSSAALDITDSSKGVLIPRMTRVQRSNIQHPAEGLLVYQTDSTKGYWSFDGLKWKHIFDLDGTAPGEMLFWDGRNWVKVASGAHGQTLTFCNGTPHWGPCPASTVYFGNGLTDIDGNSYDTVKICNQLWMKQNLNVSRYRNGDIIPQITDPTQWANLTTGAWCYYNNDSTNGAVYGKLYNWYAVNDPRGLAPEGWHVPSDWEWTTLTDCLGGAEVAGGKMKEAGTSHWNSPNTGATNSSGLSALPGGDREFDLPFNYQGVFGHWWASTQTNTTSSLLYRLDSDNEKSYLFAWWKQSGFSIRCVKDIIVIIPTLTTNPMSFITTTSAICGGIVTSDGGGNITASGVCWSTNSNPTVDLTTKTTDGTGTGSFTSSITGLTPNTTYYVRAYATNSVGTAYGNEVSFTTQTVNNNTGVGVTDIDGNTYDTVKICNQTWTKKNLNVSRYRNGDIIPQVTDPNQWANLTTGAWCYYNNDSTNGAVYGKLYNWYAVNDPRGLAPEGWHVSSDGEWNVLAKCIDPNADTNCISCSQSELVAPAIKSISGFVFGYNGTNSTGFSALPGGTRDGAGDLWFHHIQNSATWWAISSYNDNDAYIRHVNGTSNSIARGASLKLNGFSVRCVKDAPPSTLNDGLVAYYPFNGNANDESGNGNNGMVNGATLTTDRFGNSGKAYNFDNSTISVPHNSNLSILQNGQQTVSIWAYVTGAQTTQHLIGKRGDGANSFNWQIAFNYDANQGLLYSGGIINIGNTGVESTYQLPLMQWKNIIGTYNFGTWSLYVDGVLVATTNSTNFYDDISCSLTIGNSGSWGAFYGKLDDIRIYNRALTQEEISYLAEH